jgi:hypothetical protein
VFNNSLSTHPKHSAGLAAKNKFRASKSEAQARNVLMKKLGLQVETAKPDEAPFEEFQQTFTVPLSFMRREAMRGYSFLGGAGVVVW